MTVELFIAAAIYKPDRVENQRFKNRFSRVLRKIKYRRNRAVARGGIREAMTKLQNTIRRRKEEPIVEELNQFMIGSVNLKDIPHEVMERIEENFYKEYKVHSQRTLKNQGKRLRGDPELISTISGFRDLNSIPNMEISESLELLDSVIGNALNQIKDIFQDGFTIIWYRDGVLERLKSGERTIQIPENIAKHECISDLSDEIMLASFGNSHIPFICKDIEEISERLTLFVENIEQEVSGITHAPSAKFRKYMGEIASIVLGKILGIRETIIASRKQVKRYRTLRNDFEDEFPEGKVIHEIFFDAEELDRTIGTLDHLENLINENYLSLRAALKTLADLPLGESDISKSIVFTKRSAEIYARLDKLRFVVETFEDIGNFTAISGKFTDKRGVSTGIDDEAGEYVIYARNVFKTFPLINSTVYALRGVDISIKQGEYVAIMGPSGSGKTTLLNILSGLDFPDIGYVYIDGKNLSEVKERDLIRMRKDTFSFIYQSYNLLPVLQNIENITLPADYGTKNVKGNRRERGRHLLQLVGLEKFEKTRPLLLSGGQQQRVTVARAFMNNPKIIFCDEPTGDLDRKTGDQVMDIVDTLHKQGTTIIVVTHDIQVANRAERIIRMTDGKIIEDKSVKP